MSDLDRYQDSGVDKEWEAHLNSKGPAHSAWPFRQTQDPKVYPFTPQDHVISDAKCFAGPCYTCGSEKHWLRDCPKQGEYEELRRKKIVQGPSKAYKVTMFAVKASQDPGMASPTSGEEGFV